MSEKFNPYREWLDLADVETAPDHYTLLGLERFEADSQAISQAADRMMSRVRGFRPGENARVWATILDDLLDAKQCLTSPQQKAAYDTELRQGVSPPPPTESAPAATQSGSPEAAAFYPPGMVPEPTDDMMPPQPGDAAAADTTSADAARAPDQTQPSDPVQQSGAAPIDPNSHSPGMQQPTGPDQQPYYPNNQQPYPQGAQQPTQPGMQQPMQSGPAQGYDPNYPQQQYPPQPYPPQQYPPQGQQPYQPVPGQPYGGGVQQPYGQPVPQQPYPQQYGQPGAPGQPGGPAAYGQPGQAPGQQPYAPDPYQPDPGQPYGRQPMQPQQFQQPLPQPAQQPAPVPVGVSMPAGSATAAELSKELRPGSSVTVSSSMAPPMRQRSSMAMMYLGLIAGVLILGWLAIRMTGPNRGGGDVAHDADAAAPAAAGSSGPATGGRTDNGGSARSTVDSPVADGTDAATIPADPQPSDDGQPADPAVEEPADTPPADSARDGTSEADHPPRTGPLPGSPPDPEDVAVPQPPAQPAAELAELSRTLTTARRALAERNLIVAENELARAENLAKLPEHREKLDRLKTLHRYVVEFWKAVTESVDGLRANEELQIGETVALVVETRPGLLIIRIAGTNRRYTPRDIPAGLAKALAARWLDEKAASSKVILGAFLVVDPKSTPALARREWQAAQAAGFELGDMMKVIDDTYDFKTQSVEQEAAELVPERGPVPSPAAIKPVQDQFDVQYGEQVDQATSASKRFRLAERLFGAARNSTDPIERYVLLSHVRDLAMQAGQTPLMLRAIDEIGAWYDVDTLDEKTKALSKAGKSATQLLAAKSVTRGALEVLEQAVAANRPDLAVQCGDVAVATARHTRDAELAKKARERRAEVAELAQNAAAKPPE